MRTKSGSVDNYLLPVDRNRSVDNELSRLSSTTGKQGAKNSNIQSAFQRSKSHLHVWNAASKPGGSSGIILDAQVMRQA